MEYEIIETEADYDLALVEFARLFDYRNGAIPGGDIWHSLGESSFASQRIYPSNRQGYRGAWKMNSIIGALP